MSEARQQGAPGRIPEPRRPIAAGREHLAAVGAEVRVEDRSRVPEHRTGGPIAVVRATNTAIRFAIEVPVTKIPLALSGKPNI